MKQIMQRVIRKSLRSKLAGTLGLGWAPSPYRNISLSKSETTSHIGTKQRVTARAINKVIDRGDSNQFVIMLSLIPIEDSGGGQRASQLTYQFAKEGIPVLFINKFSTYEKICKPINLGDFKLIGLVDLAKLSVRTITSIFSEKPTDVTIILEAPNPELLDTALKIKSRIPNSILVYESIDVWGTSLGSSWYKPELEETAFQEADMVTATSKFLLEIAESKTESPLLYLPNAVSNQVFKTLPKKPVDLSNITALYIGALWGDWIDFEAIELLATSFPSWRINLVGSPSEKSEQLCINNPNIVSVGLIPNTELPMWIGEANVCLAPFLPGPVSSAVSPLKVFEYLAVGRPVAALGLPEIQDLPGVYMSHDRNSFPLTVLEALAKDSPTQEEAQNILLRESWEHRVYFLQSALTKIRA